MAFSGKRVFEMFLEHIEGSPYSVRLVHSLTDDEFSIMCVFGVNMINTIKRRHRGTCAVLSTVLVAVVTEDGSNRSSSHTDRLPRR